MPTHTLSEKIKNLFPFTGTGETRRQAEKIRSRKEEIEDILREEEEESARRAGRPSRGGQVKRE